METWAILLWVATATAPGGFNESVISFTGPAAEIECGLGYADLKARLGQPYLDGRLIQVSPCGKVEGP